MIKNKKTKTTLKDVILWLCICLFLDGIVLILDAIFVKGQLPDPTVGVSGYSFLNAVYWCVTKFSIMLLPLLLYISYKYKDKANSNKLNIGSILFLSFLLVIFELYTIFWYAQGFEIYFFSLVTFIWCTFFLINFSIFLKSKFSIFFSFVLSYFFLYTANILFELNQTFFHPDFSSIVWFLTSWFANLIAITFIIITFIIILYKLNIRINKTNFTILLLTFIPLLFSWFILKYYWQIYRLYTFPFMITIALLIYKNRKNNNDT
jgi:hypothetical protein